MEIKIRPANEKDKHEMALCIAECYKEVFQFISKDKDKIAYVLESGIKTHRFYVAELNDNIVGVVGLADANGRTIEPDAKTYKKAFGFVKGTLAQIMMKDNFETSLDTSKDVGTIEFLAVKEEEQRKGIAAKMLKEILSEGLYKEYRLEVMIMNVFAIRCFINLGFKEYKRASQKHMFSTEFNEKIYMKYEG